MAQEKALVIDQRFFMSKSGDAGNRKARALSLAAQAVPGFFMFKGGDFMNEIDKALAELKLVNAALMSLNNRLDLLLFDVRKAAGLCVSCGKPVEIEHEEFCNKCCDESAKDEIFRDLEQDQKIGG